MTAFTRVGPTTNAAAAFDTLLIAVGHTVTVVPKRKKRASNFNHFDGSDRKADALRSSTKSALGYATGLKM